jgi:uncharacterized protein YuzE
MKIQFDQVNNVAYIYLNERKKNQITSSLELEGHDMNVDYSDNIIVGIELLNAREQLKSLFRKNIKKTSSSRDSQKTEIPVELEFA